MLTVFSDGSQLLPLCDDIDVDIYVINGMLAMIMTETMIMIIMLTIMTKAPTNFSEGCQLLPASDHIDVWRLTFDNYNNGDNKYYYMLIMKIIMAPTNFSERGQLLPASDQAARAGDAMALARYL